MIKKRTTPEMSAEERLDSWLDSCCPYCHESITHRTDTRKTQDGPITGVHFACLNEKCGAENFFSSRRHLRIAGGE